MNRWWLAGGLLLIVGMRLLRFAGLGEQLAEGQRVIVRTRITGLPDIRWSKAYWDKQWGLTKIRIEIPVDADWGDEVEARGILAAAPWGWSMENSTTVMVKHPESVWVKWRSKLVGQIGRWLPADEGQLAVGILWGGSGEMSREAKTAFRRVGLTHIVAASGYNVSVVAGWVSWVFVAWWGRRRAIYFVILCIGMYVLLAGVSAAVVRAGIMGAVVWWGWMAGRKADAGWLLLLTALVMLAVNPAWLFDVGWQLSVAATAGLVYLAPKQKTWWWWRDFQVTMVAQLATLPLILHHFGNLSGWSPAVNATLLWTVPIIMQITAAASLVGLIIPMGGQLIAWLVWPLLRLVIGVCEWAAQLPGAGWELGKVSWWWVGGYYLLMIIGAWLITRKSRHEI